MNRLVQDKLHHL